MSCLSAAQRVRLANLVEMFVTPEQPRDQKNFLARTVGVFTTQQGVTLKTPDSIATFLSSSGVLDFVVTVEDLQVVYRSKEWVFMPVPVCENPKEVLPDKDACLSRIYEVLLCMQGVNADLRRDLNAWLVKIYAAIKVIANNSSGQAPVKDVKPTAEKIEYTKASLLRDHFASKMVFSRVSEILNKMSTAEKNTFLLEAAFCCINGHNLITTIGEPGFIRLSGVNKFRLMRSIQRLYAFWKASKETTNGNS